MSTEASSEATHSEPARHRTFRIPVSTGIFDHFREIGDALWLFLFYVDKTTAERPTPDGKFSGIVLGGRPVPDAEAAATFGCPVKTIHRWRRRLETHGIIRTRRTPFGTVVEVVNSQKWCVNARGQSTDSRAAETHARRQNFHRKAEISTRRAPLDPGRGWPHSGRAYLKNEVGSAQSGKYKEDTTGIDNTRQGQAAAKIAALSPSPREGNTKPGNLSSPAEHAPHSAPAPAAEASRSDQPKPRVPAEQQYPLTIEENLYWLRKCREEFFRKHGMD